MDLEAQFRQETGYVGDIQSDGWSGDAVAADPRYVEWLETKLRLSREEIPPGSQTLNEQARRQKWGPDLREPDNLHGALRYAIDVLGGRNRPASLGEIYALKGLQWALKVVAGKEIETR